MKDVKSNSDEIHKNSVSVEDKISKICEIIKLDSDDNDSKVLEKKVVYLSKKSDRNRNTWFVEKLLLNGSIMFEFGRKLDAEESVWNDVLCIYCCSPGKLEVFKL